MPAATSAADIRDGLGAGLRHDFVEFHLDGATYSVNVASGNLLVRTNDVAITGAAPEVAFGRSFNSLGSNQANEFGSRWAPSTAPRLEATPDGFRFFDATGAVMVFRQGADGTYIADDDFYGTLTSTSSGYRVVADETGVTYDFDDDLVLRSQTDETGSRVDLEYTSAAGQQRLARLVGPTGTTTHLSYNGDGHIIEIDDPASRHFYYDYDASDRLTSFEDADGRVTQYGYSGQSLTSIATPSGWILSIAFDSSGRVATIAEHGPAGDHSMAFAYEPPDPLRCSASDAGITTTTDQDGSVTRYCWDEKYSLTYFEGPGQSLWLEDDEVDESVPANAPGLGESSTDVGPGSSVATLSAPQGANLVASSDDNPGIVNCGRDSTDREIYNTYRVKFQRAGRTERGDRYYQYHVHFQLRRAYQPFALRTMLTTNRILPNGNASVAFDDSDTRKLRGDRWKPWYAHFIRLKVMPGTFINSQAQSKTDPIPLGNNAVLTGVRYTSICEARLRP
jgi:YD repeat-containing protein